MIVPFPPLAALDEVILDGSPPGHIVSPVVFIAPVLNKLYTVPLPVATFCVDASVLVHATFPLAPSDADDVSLTYTVVELTEPPLCDNVTLELNELLSVDTSYPVGAVTEIFAVKFVPDTEKLSDAPATPLHAVNDPIDPDVLIDGASNTFTVVLAPEE